VSNPGGRNLDISVASIDVLPSIVAEVGHKTTVLFDSGIRRGTDIVKALSLGAKAVLCGRNTLWGVAVAGEAGASKALTIMRNETLTAMANIGVNTLADLGPHLFEMPGANTSRLRGI
jgi:isopentenyl diphosphate isomerase/L-lactate dehydrogenase-like FMN-dependent dehydrogenase